MQVEQSFSTLISRNANLRMTDSDEDEPRSLGWSFGSRLPTFDDDSVSFDNSFLDLKASLQRAQGVTPVKPCEEDEESSDFSLSDDACALSDLLLPVKDLLAPPQPSQTPETTPLQPVPLIAFSDTPLAGELASYTSSL